jgi:3-oxoacyl-[acyl-carrier protein] reductase
MLCENKVAIVTGAAGKGMGRSIALTLAREGAKVVVNYRQSAEAAGEIIDYLHEKDREAIAVQADVINFEKCKKLVNKTIRKFGRVDICVISPGAGWHEETIDKLNVPDALEDITKEVAPFYHLMPLVLPGMYTRKWGRVIGISMNFIGNSPSLRTMRPKRHALTP